MNNNRKCNSLTHESAYIKTRVSRNRARVQFVGVIYLLSTLLIALAACFPLFDLEMQEGAPVGLSVFWKVLMPSNWKNLGGWVGKLSFINAGLYAVMIFVVLVCALIALAKISWLFKTKVSKTYGLNRNVYAMEDLGKLFSFTYALVLSVYFVMSVLCGESYINNLMFLIIGIGLVVHLICGLIGGNASYFNIEDGRITEDARNVGRAPAFLRNVLQLVSVFVMMYYFQKVSTLHTVIGPLMESGAASKYVVGQPLTYVSIFFQFVACACLVPLLFHATSTTEYNIDGALGAGMKTFKIFIVVMFLAMGAVVAGQYLFGQMTFELVDGVVVNEAVQALNVDAIILAVIAFAMCMVELIMRNMPYYDNNSNVRGEKRGQRNECVSSNSPAVVVHIYNN